MSRFGFHRSSFVIRASPLQREATGFTLIEVVLVVALVALISGLGLQFPRVFASHQGYDTDTSALVTALYRARTLAMTQRADTAWGVMTSDDGVTVFSGDTYAARNPDTDTEVLFTVPLTVSGMTEVVFGGVAGLPEAAATISLDFGDVRSDVTINAYGTIDFRTL